MSGLGIPQDILIDIQNVLSSYPQVIRASVFGSRAKGTHKPFSDIDIALYGQLDLWIIEDIKCELDDIPSAFKFDVVGYDLITNAELKKHIDRVEIEIWRTI